jgi:hypothetical protein
MNTTNENDKDKLETAYKYACETIQTMMITQKLMQIDIDDRDYKIQKLEKQLSFERSISIMAVDQIRNKKDYKIQQLEDTHKNELMALNITCYKMETLIIEQNEELKTRECMADSHIHHIHDLLKQIDILQSYNKELIKRGKCKNKIYCAGCLNKYHGCTCISLEDGGEDCP